MVKGTAVLVFLVLATVGVYAQDYANSVPIATGLSCDGKGSAPDNVSTYSPMFSWTFTDADVGDGQTGYSIQVRRDADSFVVWNLPKQDLATNTRMYGGSPLAANTLYDWSVQVWDRAGQASASAQGSFAVLDIGLRLYDGSSTVTIATDKVKGTDPVTDANRLRISKGGTTYSILLGNLTDYGVSKVRVWIPSGTKALKMMVAPPPAIGLGPGNLDFSGVVGGASPAGQTVGISDVGGGTLSGLGASISYGSGSGWLGASLGSATAPATLTVTPATGSLVGGIYTATIGVASGVAGNSPQSVNVTLSLSCTVAYAGNGNTGGSAPTDGSTYLPGATVTVLGSGSLVRTGYAFSGWNTQADGNGTTYTQGQTFTMGSANVTLHALWTAIPTYTVTYNGNGATGGSAPIDGSNYPQASLVTVLGSGTLVKTGYSLAGWNTQSSGLGTSYAATASFSMGTADVNLYAVWIPSNLTFTSAGTSIRITGYTTAPTGSLAIPGGVTSLGVNAFVSCSGLTSVTIPASVTEISYLAFQLCTGLTSIAIPSSVTTIGWEAFLGCTGLTSFIVDAANPNYQSINGVLFDKAATTLIEAPGGLAGSYTIPSSVTTIAMNAFERCPNLTGVTIPSSVTQIGWHAFRNCDGLTSVSIPASVTLIDEAPFLDCSNLAAITVDSANPNYKSLSGVLFSKDGTLLVEAPGGMTGSYSVPAGVTRIGEAAFMGGSLTSISLPNGVTVIGGYAFAFTQLTAFTIPSSVTTIETYAFERIPNVSSITIPANVTSIGSFAFEACPNLSSVTVLAVTPPALPPSLPSGNGAFSFCAPGLQIHVPSGSLAAYKAATGWSDYSSIIVSP